MSSQTTTSEPVNVDISLLSYVEPERQEIKKFVAGTYDLNINSIKKKIAKTGTLQLEMELSPVLDGSVSNRKVRHWLTLPFANPTVNGHKQPNTMDMCYNFLAALELVPRKPLYIKDSKSFTDINGNPISQAEFSAAKSAVYAACDEQLKKLWADDAELQNLVGVRVGGYLRFQKDKDTGVESQYPSIGNFTSNVDNAIASEADAFGEAQE